MSSTVSIMPLCFCITGICDVVKVINDIFLTGVVTCVISVFRYCLFLFVQPQMPSYKQIKEFIQTAKGEQIPKNTILVPDWLIWMFHYIDFWTLVSCCYLSEIQMLARCNFRKVACKW